MILGLTGGIASGKSTVASYFKQRGIPVCDTDQLARDVVLPGTIGLKKLIDAFGDAILNADDGTLNRAKLGEIIFNHDRAREQVNKMLHPLIFERVELFKQEHAHAPLAVVDMPLLFETGYNTYVDKIMVVYVDETVQYERLMLRNQLTPQQAKQRIAAQMSLSDKCRLADVIIDNNGSRENTFLQVEKYLKHLKI